MNAPYWSLGTLALYLLLANLGMFFLGKIARQSYSGLRRTSLNKYSIALITNIGELIYMYSENELYEYNKLIKSLEGQDELKATFYDNTWLKIKGNYYVLNEKTKS